MFYSENFSYSMDERSFEKILEEITRETDAIQKKLDILFFSHGKFNAEQAEKILFMIPSHSAKLEALRIMEPRLTPMTCQQARRILRTFIVYDRVDALHSIKRYLCDCQTKLGEECILSMFPFDEQKHAALSLLSSVRANLQDKMAAGSLCKQNLCAGLPSLPLNTDTYAPIKLKHPQLLERIPMVCLRKEDHSAGLPSKHTPIDIYARGPVEIKHPPPAIHSQMTPPRHYLASLYPSNPTYVFAQPDYYAEQQRLIKDGHRCNMRCVNAYSSTGNSSF